MVQSDSPAAAHSLRSSDPPQLSKQRSFTPEFKARVVLQILTGTKTTAQVCREHQLSEQLVSQWKKRLLARASQAFAQGRDRSGTEARVAELERMIGHLTIDLEAAKKPPNS